MRRRLKQWLMGFARDHQGLAAIEFAMLAPLMLLIYFGMVEFSQAFMANRRANHMASIVADLIAQGETTTPAEVDLVFDIGALVLKPFDDGTLSMRVSSITWTANNQAVVNWSRSRGGSIPALTKGAVMTGVPTDLITKDQTLIVGESHYTYSSRMTQIIKQPLTFQRRYYLRPRIADSISCTGC